MIIYIEDQRTFDKAIELWFKNEVPSRVKSMRLSDDETPEEIQLQLLEKYAKTKGISPYYTSVESIDYDLFIKDAKSMLAMQFIQQGFPMILYADIVGNRSYQEIILEGSSVEDAKSIHYPDLN